MDAIISNAGANTSDVKTSSPNTDIVAGLLHVQGKQGGKGTGKGKLGPTDLAGLSAFAGMLKLASRESAPGTAKGFLPGGENTASTGKSPLKAGNRKMAVFAEGKAPVDGSGGINLYALLQGLGLQKEQVEKVVQEIEGALSRLAGASAKEKGMAGDKIAALLEGYGFTDEKIQEVLSALANSRFVSPGSLPGQQDTGKETGEVSKTAERSSGASGEVALGGIAENVSIPPDGRETKEAQEDGAAIKAAPDGKGRELPPYPVHAPDAGRRMVSEGKGALGGYAPSGMDAEQGNKTRAVGAADDGDAALKQGAVPPLREALAKKEPQQIQAASPLTEAGEGTNAAGGEKSLPAGKDMPTEGKDAGNARIRAKQRPPVAFKEQIAGAQQSREGRDRLPGETAADGKNGGDASLMEMAAKKTGREDAGDRTVSVRGPGGAAENAATGRVEQGNLFTFNGALNDVKAETAPGLRPEVLIDQIVANAGQFPQNGPGRIKITLNPPHLGTLDMDVLIRNNKVEVVMIASSQEVQQVLKAHGDQLKNALQGQGFKMDGFDVMLQGNQAGPEYRFRNGNFTHDGRNESGGSKGEAAAVASRGIVPSHKGTGAENVDGISLFV